jgi:radical SAM superfamily enzyme with C-terminal helix-hairpin-helix motif
VSTAQAASCAKLNLNALSQDALMATIPNFSNRMVREFLEYTPYVSIQQFRREIGKYVDASQVAEYEKYVYVPVDPNNSDADTLKQLPGVDDAIAAELINGRPYASNAAFVQALATRVSDQQLAESTCYLVAQP